MVFPRIIEAAKRGEPLRVFGDGTQTRCFCSVNDAVEALIRLQNHPAAFGEVFNIGSIEEVAIGKLAEMVIQTLNSKSEIEFVPYAAAYGQGFEDMLRRKPNVEKIAKVIGFSPMTPLKTIIEKTCAK